MTLGDYSLYFGLTLIFSTLFAMGGVGSAMNFRRGVLEIRFALPFILSILIATPIGAWSSQFVEREAIEWMLITFLIVAALLLLFSRRSTGALANAQKLPGLEVVFGRARLTGPRASLIGGGPIGIEMAQIFAMLGA